MSNYIDSLVSVIMPTYRRSDKLIRAIESVLNQTYTCLELIVVNDNDPTDSYTTELIDRVAKYKSDTRFKLVIQEKHINGAVARNIGIKQSKGEFIAFLDDDDWWECNKIQRQVETLKTLDETWGGVSCRISQYKDNRFICTMPKYRDGRVYKDILMLRSDFATGTLLLRHDALDLCGYFDESLLRHQDLQLLINFSFRFKIKQLDEALHCCDISDETNRPDWQKAKKAKESLFVSVADIIQTLSNYEKRTMYAVHKFELAYLLYKNGNKSEAIKTSFSVFATPHAFAYSLNRVCARMSQRKKQRKEGI